MRIVKGAWGYWVTARQRARHGDRGPQWGSPFNGQQHRLSIFRELQAAYSFKSMIETGAATGNTTAFLADELGATVRTAELDPWRYGFCLARFLFKPNVRVRFADSRRFLRSVAPQPGSVPFFYLDAHWGPDLPLHDELAYILSRWGNAVVMVDDFEVIGDPNYGFDDYGPGKRLSFEYISTLVDKFKPSVFFPAASANTETGACRGCIVLLGPALSCPPHFVTLREYRASEHRRAS